MKRFEFWAILLLVCIVSGLAAQLFMQEVHVQRWEEAVTTAERIERQNNQLAMAQIYGDKLAEACRMLTVENGILTERDQKLSKYVAAVEEEDMYLRNALKEAVEGLEEQRQELSELYDENNDLQFKIRCLERALEVAEKVVEELRQASEDTEEDLSDV